MKIRTSIIFYFCFVLPILSAAQSTDTSGKSESSGIAFVKGLHWDEILGKAQTESKVIFVDCYATWCGPCKEMERDVYVVPAVREFANRELIPVKVQLDSSKSDDEDTRRFYADAARIVRQYKVTGLPTYLFFSPDGRLLDRAVGAEGADVFLKRMKEAADPTKNYYTLLTNYNGGKATLSEMSYLAGKALTLGDTIEARRVIGSFYVNLDKSSWLNKESIEVLYKFTKSSDDIGFGLFYKHANEVDEIMGDVDHSDAQGFIASILLHEFIMPKVEQAKKSGNTPDWLAIQHDLKKRFSDYYVDRALLAAKTNWAGEHGAWDQWAKYYILNEEKYGPKAGTGHWVAFHLNQAAWVIFEHSVNREALEKALTWSRRAVLMDPLPNWMDTYANLLYKLGQVELAIEWETAANRLEPRNKSFQEMLEKMKKNNPTWEQKL